MFNFSKPYEFGLLIIFLIIWIYLLSVLKRKKLSAFFFMLGTTGTFLITFSVFKSLLAKIFTKILCFILEYISHILPWYTMYRDYNIIFIDHNDAAISLFIDYECSGVIEILVITSIIAFFPLFNAREKIFYSFIGFIYTMFANIIRLIAITGIIYRYGNNVYYLAHSIVGRIIFYILTLFLYFYILSFKQIKAQKVGKFNFSNSDKKE